MAPWPFSSSGAPTTTSLNPSRLRSGTAAMAIPNRAFSCEEEPSRNPWLLRSPCRYIKPKMLEVGLGAAFCFNSHWGGVFRGLLLKCPLKKQKREVEAPYWMPFTSPFCPSNSLSLTLLTAYIGDGEDVDFSCLLLLLTHVHRRSNQQKVSNPVSVHIQRTQHTSEIRADLRVPICTSCSTEDLNNSTMTFFHIYSNI